MLPYTAYDVVRMVNHEVDLSRKPVREFNHAFRTESEHRSDGTGGGRGRLASALALFSRRPRIARQPAAQPLS